MFTINNSFCRVNHGWKGFHHDLFCSIMMIAQKLGQSKIFVYRSELCRLINIFGNYSQEVDKELLTLKKDGAIVDVIFPEKKKGKLCIEVEIPKNNFSLFDIRHINALKKGKTRQLFYYLETLRDFAMCTNYCKSLNIDRLCEKLAIKAEYYSYKIRALARLAKNLMEIGYLSHFSFLGSNANFVYNKDFQMNTESKPATEIEFKIPTPKVEALDTEEKEAPQSIPEEPKTFVEKQDAFFAKTKIHNYEEVKGWLHTNIGKELNVDACLVYGKAEGNIKRFCRYFSTHFLAIFNRKDYSINTKISASLLRKLPPSNEFVYTLDAKQEEPVKEKPLYADIAKLPPVMQDKNEVNKDQSATKIIPVKLPELKPLPERKRQRFGSSKPVVQIGSAMEKAKTMLSFMQKRELE